MKVPGLEQLRVERGLTQAELAERSAVSRDSILNYEKGRREPHSATLKKLAAALGVSTEALTNPPPKPEPDWKIQSLRDNVKGLEQLEEIHELLSGLLEGVGGLKGEELKRREALINRTDRLLRDALKSTLDHAREMYRIDTGGVEEAEIPPEQPRERATA